MADLSSGTYTFLFTDIEGSTIRWERAPAAMQAALARHDAIMREAIEARGGEVFKTVGDAFCAAFRIAPDALAAALTAQLALESEPWAEAIAPLRVRMGLQTGAAERRDDDYFGPPLNRVARLVATAHGGQTVIGLTTAELVRDNLPDGADLRDLGEHRLKDLARPERIFQLAHPSLQVEFPTLRTLDRRPNNLPIQATPLVGREREVAAVREQLLRPDVRLLTLSGPGGTGKTRLSLQVAAELIDQFEGGVFFVPLAPTTEAGLVVSAIAQALDVQEGSGRDLLSTLQDVLRDKPFLLVLDNFEQVLGAASIVADLLQTCPQLKVLVTSRAVLHVYGEHEYPVPPLALPEPGQTVSIEKLTQYAAVRLFIERARLVRPDFEVTNDNAPAVAEICSRLDGLPLAIELAAARIKMLSPEAILARLTNRLKLLTGGSRDLPARQQTLRGAIAWGHDLLDDGEKRLFARLAAFAGSFALEAAEAVTDPDGDLDVDVLDGVSSLVDKSLLRQEDGPDGESRFRMLQTIHEYALEQLEAGGDEQVTRSRHAEYYLTLTEQGASRLKGRDQVAWLHRLGAEHDNLRAALAWFKAAGEPEPALRMAGSLWWFWQIRSHFSEGRAWFDDVLSLTDANDRTPARAKVLFGSGVLAWLQSDYQTARARVEEAAAILHEAGDRHGAAYAAIHLGQAALMQGEVAESRAHYEEGLADLRELGDTWGAGLALFFMGNAAVMDGDYDRAVLLLEESRTLFTRTGDTWGNSLPMSVLGRVALQRGDFEMARIKFEASLALRTELQDKWGRAQLLNSLGDTARGQGDYARARPYYEESLTLFRESGSRGGVASLLHNLGYVVVNLDDPGRAASLFGQSLAIFRELGDRRGVAECLAGLGGVAAAEGRPARAARLFGASEALLEAVGSQLSASNQADYARKVFAARAGLNAAEFEAAWAEGRTLSAEQALADSVDLPSAATA